MAYAKLGKIWAALLLLGLSTMVVACGGPANPPAGEVDQQDDDQPDVQPDQDDDEDGDNN
ncbi:MAG: hypothetical protein IGS50_23655 [Synechococcales cyanobacterium C42_A2020_086]|jgi:hypothetical protein|nr:hypothetical protein [Synechococcales cyanobacterium C42_A2020_086]